MILQYLKEKVQQQDLNHISKKLGYSNLKNFEKTLLEFSKSSSIIEWFESSHYDLVNTNEDFFIKLSKVLNIDDQIILDELEIIKLYKNEIDQFKNSYIFVNTNFKREGESILTLAMLENKRRISLYKDEKFLFKPINEILELVSSIVEEHYKINNGKCFIWGDIVNYQLHLFDNLYTYSIDGKLTDEKNNLDTNIASISI